MTTQEQEQTRNSWNNIAANYDTFVTPKNIGLAEEALRLAGLRPGMRFLDVAAGSGALSIPAARLGAQVLSVDFAPVMVERLNARACDEGLSGLEACVMDGHALDLEDDTFDISGSQNGVYRVFTHFGPEPRFMLYIGVAELRILFNEWRANREELHNGTDYRNSDRRRWTGRADNQLSSETTRQRTHRARSGGETH
jgi:SAM-dependent methyltransferase